MVALFAGGIDGLWANSVKDVSIVVNPEAYRLSVQTFRDATGQDLGDVSFADYAMHYGGWWTNKRMPDKASDIAQAILYRKGRSMQGGSRGMRTAVCPHWGEVGDSTTSTPARHPASAATPCTCCLAMCCWCSRPHTLR